ncbi:unnamed protein product [Clavelina lepadiformis]|uniref:Strictosidine synthase conserved region domain-containing protein n=1 Tax=Clavelina lepadiformis TaxID=159417 RepID=A0ABP0FZV8_CLALP
MLGDVRKRKQKARQEEYGVGKLQVKLPSKSNGFSSCINSIGIMLVVIAATGLFGYYRAPYTCLPDERLTVEVKLTGPFAFKSKLKQGSKITGLPNPESIAEDDKKNLYVGLSDGRIIQIKPSADGGRIGAGDTVNLTSGIIKNIPAVLKDVSHGWPLGLRLRGDTLYVADANYGIYTVNARSGKVETLVKVNDVNPSLRIADDLDITRDGKFIYFSDLSASTVDKFMYDVYAGVCKGRVFEYNTETKRIRVVASNLCMANGIQLSQDEKFLFVAESVQCAIHVIDLTTWKTVRTINIPVIPDNIRPTGKGTYWIAAGLVWTHWYSFLERNPIIYQADRHGSTQLQLSD